MNHYIARIARWLWPTMPSQPAPRPVPNPSTHPVTWEQWHGWPVRVITGPFKGRIGMAGGIGWGQIEVVFRNRDRIWFHGDLLELLRPTESVIHPDLSPLMAETVVVQ